MTKYLQDIYKQPEQLSLCLEYSLTTGRKELNKAAARLKQSNAIFISAIGASYNAGIALQASLNEAGIIAVLCDAADFLYFTKIQPNSTVIFLSRSGKSIEIVNAITKCKLAKATIISITNAHDGEIAKNSDYCLLTHVAFDNSISVSTYTAIILVAQLLSLSIDDSLEHSSLFKTFENSLKALSNYIQQWDKLLDGFNWINPKKAFYFIARGMNLASAHEAMLLWEEAAKQPASALTTGSFRHGPQEIVNHTINVGIWVDSTTQNNDIQLINDLNKYCVGTLTIGTAIPSGTKGHVIEMPTTPTLFHPVVNIIPLQIASEKLSLLKGETPDSFKFCDFVVETEGGL